MKRLVHKNERFLLLLYSFEGRLKAYRISGL